MVNNRLRRWAVGLMLLIFDGVGMLLASALGLATRMALFPLLPVQIPWNATRAVLIGWGLTTLLACAVVDLYPGYGLGRVTYFRRKTLALLASFVVSLAFERLARQALASRGVLLASGMWAGILLLGPGLWLREWLSRKPFWGEPVLVLGAAKTGNLVIRALLADRWLGYCPVAVFDDDERKWGQRIEGVPVVGPISQVGSYSDTGIRRVIVAIPGLEREQLVSLVNALAFPHIVVIPDLFGLQTLWVESRDLNQVLGLEVRKNLLLRRNRYLKRGLDLLIGIPAFLAALPVIGIAAVLIKVVSPGPAFYVQKREGYGGKPLWVPKLRTMYPDAEQRLETYLQENPQAREEWEKYYKLRKDPRVLPIVGTILRRSSLDELPQLWLVLKGEMSLVGPRPFPHYHLARFPEDFRILRRQVLPGITGLWQVVARSEGDLQIQQNLDIYYIRNWSLWLDLYILVQTVKAVLKGTGAY